MVKIYCVFIQIFIMLTHRDLKTIQELQKEPAVIESKRMREKQEQLEFRRKVAMEKRV